MWATFLIGIASVFLISPRNDEVRTLLQSLGPLAPLAYFLAEIVQIIIIPIPGQPFEVAGGWLLGMPLGTFVGVAGAVVGSMASFYIARRFGRRWVQDHVAGGVSQRVEDDRRRGQRMEWIVFWLMMIPNFPRDPLCYVAGVSGMSPRAFLLIALLGRPVGLVPWVALGAEGAAAGIEWQLVMIVVAAAIWGMAKLLGRYTTSPADVEAEPEPEG